MSKTCRPSTLPTNLHWRKSTRSNNNGECLEAAQLGAIIAIRDSKLDTTGDFPVLTVSPTDWNSLLSTVNR